MPAPERVLKLLEARLPQALDDLIGLARIPSVSAPGFPEREVSRCAEAVAALFRGAGLEDVELLHLPDAHPYVYAHWRGAGPDRPTLLLYAHYDVQPPGRLERWISPPFEPAQREGRLYGRGVVDDKAGVVILAEAIRAWLESEGSLPVNVKLIAEGEEEIGSTHLEEFLRGQHERLAADLIVLTDTANLEQGLPSLTTSLRGLVNIDVRVRSLDHPLHSGIWGGPVPDAGSALAMLLGRLFDSQGSIQIPGLDADVPEVGTAEGAELARLPFDEATFRRDAGMLAGSRLRVRAEAPVYGELWNRPSVAITALEAVPLAEAANQLLDTAAARVGIRLAPGQDAERVRDLCLDFLAADPPLGASVELECESAVAGWRRTSSGEEMDAARRALRAGYGRDPICIGCGGSIPFVDPFSRALEGAPALLLGLEDPLCNAHAENESLHLGDFRSALRAMAHLLVELSEFGR